MAETERVVRELLAFNKQVNAAIVGRAFIVNVRKKLDLGQRKAAKSSAVASLSSHATRTVRPSRPWL